MIPLSRLDKWRLSAPSFWQGAGRRGDDRCGVFRVKRKGVWIRMIATVGDDWDHVSVSTRCRCPSWEEMAWVADKFFEDEPAMQLHVSRSDHVNYHPYCLHWWRPTGKQLPLPPYWMVGPKQEDIKEVWHTSR